MDVISYQYSITHMYNNNEMLNNSLFIIVLETNADGLGVLLSIIILLSEKCCCISGYRCYV